MNVFEIFGELFRFAFSRVRDVLIFIVTGIITLAKNVYGKFLDSNIFEKIIFINIIASFFAIILPVARYFIFQTYFYINNPLAVYMIGITLIMFITTYFRGLVKLSVRIVLNIYYSIWIVYLPLAGELTKADPHELCTGYYLNIFVPAINIVCSLLSRLMYDE